MTCIHGHACTKENTGYSRGARFCRVCKRAKDLRRYNRLKHRALIDKNKGDMK